jgi:nucleotide-binding universal stress UspA family protein
MKILATFDGSVFAESIIPQVKLLSALPGAELLLLSIGEVPHGQLASDVQVPVAATAGNTAGSAIVVPPMPPEYAETKEQAVERVKAELGDYLGGIARQLPASAPCTIHTAVADDVRSAIVKFAIQSQVDLIVMATHGRTGVVHALFGDVAESVLRAGVAPVLLVPPQAVAESRQPNSGSA